jgi:hypothetical protein
MMRPLFQKFLETRERLNCDEKDYKAIHKRKGIQVPPLMTSQKWKSMSLSEQYETVFGPIDPSRKKLRELPYFVKIVSRQRPTIEEPVATRPTHSVEHFEIPVSRNSQNACQGGSQVSCRCVYCKRENCKGCPLRFDDKITLR